MRGSGSPSRTRLWGLVCLVGLLGVSWPPLQQTTPAAAQSQPPSCDWSQQQYDDFYAPPALDQFLPDQSGTLLRVEHVRSYTRLEVADAGGVLFSPYSAEVYRVLHLSQAPLGILHAVSAQLVVPGGTVPPGGFPVIARGHATVGLADAFALSKFKNLLSPQDILSWVARGYVVSSSDYIGLGTPGLHPYLVGDATAFSLLDSARAALHFCDTAHGFSAPVAANRIFLVGHSQGGHAALFAHELWSSYAPELNMLGTVALAPASELRFLVQGMVTGRSPTIDPAVLAMYAYSKYYGRPDSLLPWLKEPYASQLEEKVEQRSIIGLGIWIGQDPNLVFQPSFIAAAEEERWGDLEPWTTYLDMNTPGDFTSPVPVLVVQGTADTVVPFEASERVARRMCDNETPAKFSLYYGADHLVGNMARSEVLQWVADRLEGREVTDSCIFSEEQRIFVPLVVSALP
jgi:pimeloyl-ACP methyl ester carboxylesterase